MKLGFQGGLPGHMYITPVSVDRSLSQNRSHVDIGKGGKNADEVKLSPQGKMMNLIKALSKQREDVTQRKNELIRTTLENGGELDDIKSQLNSFEEKLDTIDTQISQITADMARIAAEKKAKEKEKEKEPDKNKTEKELENERIHDIAALPADIKQAQAVMSAANKSKRDVNLKKGEIQGMELFLDILYTKELGKSIGKGVDMKAVMNNVKDEILKKQKVLHKSNAFDVDINAKLDSVIKRNARQVDEIEEKGIVQRKGGDSAYEDSKASLQNALPLTEEEEKDGRKHRIKKDGVI